MVARPYLGIIQLSRDGCIRASTVFGHNPTLAVFQRHGAPGPWAWGHQWASGNPHLRGCDRGNACDGLEEKGEHQDGPADLHGGETCGWDPLPGLPVVQGGQKQECKGEPAPMWVVTLITTP